MPLRPPSHPHRSELPSSLSPSCLTIQRHPVDRVISFYYERIHPFTLRPLSALDPSELDFLARNFYGSAFSKYRDEVGWLITTRSP